MNTTRSFAVFASLLLACGMATTARADKLRVVILTDISNEPDDQQSLVRFLTYANEFDVEGMIATTSCWRRNNPDKPTILQVLDAYDRALPNLRKHAAGYPDADALRRVTKAGVDGFGMSAAAEQLEHEGFRHIVSVLERDDPRPVWFCVWGGGNTLGGAVMKLRRERPADVARLVAKIRGYGRRASPGGQALCSVFRPSDASISRSVLRQPIGGGGALLGEQGWTRQIWLGSLDQGIDLIWHPAAAGAPFPIRSDSSFRRPRTGFVEDWAWRLQFVRVYPAPHSVFTAPEDRTQGLTPGKAPWDGCIRCAAKVGRRSRKTSCDPA